MELWNAHLKNGRPPDAISSAARQSRMADATWYVRCWSSIGASYLLMQRVWNKIGYPGMFKAGASGSVLKKRKSL